MEIVLGSAVVVIVLLAVGWVTANRQKTTPTHYADGPPPDQIEIAPDITRITVRAERPRRPPKQWQQVRIQFFAGGDQPAQQLTFDRWTMEAMRAFEDRLAAAGWQQSGYGSSEQLPEGFDDMQQFTIFTRPQT